MDAKSVEDLANWFSTTMPLGMAFAVGRIDEGEPLFPDEITAISNAVPKRVAEFSTGRSLARSALTSLGCASLPIPIGHGRQPVWPDGYLGSITHSESVAAAAVARDSAFLGIGIDIEPSLALPSEVTCMIIASGEPDLEGRATPPPSLDLGALCFVAKEALYKAYAPSTGTFLNFRDVRISIDWGRGTFVGTLVNPAHPGIGGRRDYNGFLGKAGGHLVAGVFLRRE